MSGDRHASPEGIAPHLFTAVNRDGVEADPNRLRWFGPFVTRLVHVGERDVRTICGESALVKVGQGFVHGQYVRSVHLGHDGDAPRRGLAGFEVTEAVDDARQLWTRPPGGDECGPSARLCKRLFVDISAEKAQREMVLGRPVRVSRENARGEIEADHARALGDPDGFSRSGTRVAFLPGWRIRQVVDGQGGRQRSGRAEIFVRRGDRAHSVGVLGFTMIGRVEDNLPTCTLVGSIAFAPV